MKGYDIFIPKDIEDLHEKLKTENLQGRLSREGESLIWKLPNNIILKIFVNDIKSEGKLSF